MKTKKFLFYVLAALLGGCIPVMSLHPLFTEETLVFEEKLLGTWVDDSNNIWEFKDPNEQEKIYKLIFIDDEGKKGSFDARLTKLENKLFLDVYPSEPPWDEEDPNKVEWPFNTLFFMPVHTFIKINGIEPELKLQLTDDDELKKLLKEDPNVVKHELVEDRIILTASTKELQAFVVKYADDSRVFTAEVVLARKETKSPQPSPEKGLNEGPKGK
ncbi:hypothetical protein ES703_94557 [subsurface metagenome]